MERGQLYRGKMRFVWKEFVGEEMEDVEEEEADSADEPFIPHIQRDDRA